MISLVSKNLIAFYVNGLTYEQGIQLAKKHGVNFTLEEAKVILPFLKLHRHELEVGNIDRLLNLIKPKVNSATLQKIIFLLNKIDY